MLLRVGIKPSLQRWNAFLNSANIKYREGWQNKGKGKDAGGGMGVAMDGRIGWSWVVSAVCRVGLVNIHRVRYW